MKFLQNLWENFPNNFLALLAFAALCYALGALLNLLLYLSHIPFYH